MNSLACFVALLTLLSSKATSTRVRNGAKPQHERRNLQGPSIPSDPVELVIGDPSNSGGSGQPSDEEEPIDFIVDLDTVFLAQQTSEDYVVDLYTDAEKIASNGGRDTVEEDDLELVVDIRRDDPRNAPPRRRLMDYEAEGAGDATVLDMARIDYDEDGAGDAKVLDLARGDSSPNPLDAIPKRVFRELAKRVGIKHISTRAVETTRELLRAFLVSVIRDAAQFAVDAGRHNITAKDFLNALQNRRPICPGPVFVKKSKSRKGKGKGKGSKGSKGG